MMSIWQLSLFSLLLVAPLRVQTTEMEAPLDTFPERLLGSNSANRLFWQNLYTDFWRPAFPPSVTVEKGFKPSMTIDERFAKSGLEKQLDPDFGRKDGEHAGFKWKHTDFLHADGEHTDFNGEHTDFNGEHAGFKWEHTDFNGEHTDFNGEHTDFNREHTDFNEEHTDFNGEHTDHNPMNPKYEDFRAFLQGGHYKNDILGGYLKFIEDGLYQTSYLQNHLNTMKKFATQTNNKKMADMIITLRDKFFADESSHCGNFTDTGEEMLYEFLVHDNTPRGYDLGMLKSDTTKSLSERADDILKSAKDGEQPYSSYYNNRKYMMNVVLRGCVEKPYGAAIETFLSQLEEMSKREAFTSKKSKKLYNKTKDMLQRFNDWAIPHRKEEIKYELHITLKRMLNNTGLKMARIQNPDKVLKMFTKKHLDYMPTYEEVFKKQDIAQKKYIRSGFPDVPDQANFDDIENKLNQRRLAFLEVDKKIIMMKISDLVNPQWLDSNYKYFY